MYDGAVMHIYAPERVYVHHHRVRRQGIWGTKDGVCPKGALIHIGTLEAGIYESRKCAPAGNTRIK